MKTRGSILLVVVALLLLLPPSAKATPFLYTISFDAMNISGSLWPADSFSFSVDSIITSPQRIEMPTEMELSGISFTALVISLDWPSLQFVSPGVSGSESFWSFGFRPDAFPGGVGTYPSINNAVYAETMPCLGCGLYTRYFHGSGTLTITDTGASTVPDPGSSLLLLGIGLGGLRAWRRRGQ